VKSVEKKRLPNWIEDQGQMAIPRISKEPTITMATNVEENLLQQRDTGMNSARPERVRGGVHKAMGLKTAVKRRSEGR